MPGRPAPEIKPNKDGSVSIEYKPQQSGVHELSLTYNEQNVEGKIPIKKYIPLKTGLEKSNTD